MSNKSVVDIPPLFSFGNAESTFNGERFECFEKKQNKNVAIISETRLEELRAQENLRRKRLARKAELARISRKQKREKMQNLESENIKLKKQLTQNNSINQMNQFTCNCNQNICNYYQKSDYQHMLQCINHHKQCLQKNILLVQNMSQSQSISDIVNSVNSVNQTQQDSNCGDSVSTLVAKFNSVQQCEFNLFANLASMMQEKQNLLFQLIQANQMTTQTSKSIKQESKQINGKET